MYVDDNCTGCGICVDSCPMEAIALVEGKAVIDREICIDCTACAYDCPFEAIHEED